MCKLTLKLDMVLYRLQIKKMVTHLLLKSCMEDSRIFLLGHEWVDCVLFGGSRFGAISYFCNFPLRMGLTKSVLRGLFGTFSYQRFEPRDPRCATQDDFTTDKLIFM